MKGAHTGVRLDLNMAVTDNLILSPWEFLQSRHLINLIIIIGSFFVFVERGGVQFLGLCVWSWGIYWPYNTEELWKIIRRCLKSVWVAFWLWSGCGGFWDVSERWSIGEGQNLCGSVVIYTGLYRMWRSKCINSLN